MEEGNKTKIPKTPWPPCKNYDTSDPSREVSVQVVDVRFGRSGWDARFICRFICKFHTSVPQVCQNVPVAW